MRRTLTPFRLFGPLHLCLIAFVLLFPALAVALVAPPQQAFAASVNGIEDVSGGVSGRTIIAEVNYSDYNSRTESSCTWTTTVISTAGNEPYSFSVRAALSIGREDGC